MGIALEQSEESSVIRLDGTINITMAGELKKSLLQALTGGKAVLLSLDKVTDLDVTAMQLLWAARLEAKASGVGFTVIDSVPEPVTSALECAGLEEFAAIIGTKHTIGVNPCQP